MITDYNEQRRIEREKKEKQEAERKARARLIAKQIAKDNPDWKYAQMPENEDRNILTHKDGAQVSISCSYPYRKIIAAYTYRREDFSGGPPVEGGVDGDRNVMEAAKSLAKRILPAALEKYADNEYAILLQRYDKICEANTDPESMRQYVQNRRCTLRFLSRDEDDARGEIEIIAGARPYNKITIDYLSHEQAQKLIYAIRETLNK